MAELDQFNTGATNDLADFQTDDQLAAPVTNASSNQNIAAHVSMLSSNPGDTAGTYNTIRDEYDTLGYSPTADEVTKAAKEDNTQAYRRSSADLLLVSMTLILTYIVYELWLVRRKQRSLLRMRQKKQLP